MNEVTIDFSNVQVGDDGHTSHYGGSYTITGTVGLTTIEKTIQCGGNDRGDNYRDDILGYLEDLGFSTEDWDNSNEWPEWDETIYIVSVKDSKVVSILPKTRMMCPHHPESAISHIRQAWESREVFADGSLGEVSDVEVANDFYTYQCDEGCAYETWDDLQKGKLDE